MWVTPSALGFSIENNKRIIKKLVYTNILIQKDLWATWVLNYQDNPSMLSILHLKQTNNL